MWNYNVLSYCLIIFLSLLYHGEKYQHPQSIQDTALNSYFNNPSRNSLSKMHRILIYFSVMTVYRSFCQKPWGKQPHESLQFVWFKGKCRGKISLLHIKILVFWEVCELSALIPETTSIVLLTQMKSYINSRAFETFQTRQWLWL